MGVLSPLLAEGFGCGSSPLLAGVRQPLRWLFPLGLVGGFPCCVCLWRGACAWSLCWRASCVFVVSVLLVVCVLVCLPRVYACVCVCAFVLCWWSVVAGTCFSRLELLLVLVGVWLVCAVVGPSPLVAEVPVCDSPPLLAGFRCRWWWVFLATPG